MNFNTLRHYLTVGAGALLIAFGLGLGLWALTNLPMQPQGQGILAIFSPLNPLADNNLQDESRLAKSLRSESSGESSPRPDLGAATLSPLPPGTPAADAPGESVHAPQEQNGLAQEIPETDAPLLVIGAGEDLPSHLLQALHRLDAETAAVQLTARDAPTATVSLQWEAHDGVPFYRQLFAAATRFDTIDPELELATLRELWARRDPDSSAPFAAIVYLQESRPALEQLLGEAGPLVYAVDDQEEVLAAAWTTTPTLALLPFEMLHPRLTVLSVDGQNPVENGATFQAAGYALTALVYIHGHIAEGRLTRPQADLLQVLPNTNRDADRLTVVAATGVTALTRRTAAEMEARGYGWPAEVVGPRLAQADITVISNEVPFIEGCEPNTDLNNLVFCSKPEYMETLLASGVTVVGLTGNHQNDFGWQGMRNSLEVYAEHGIPVYGGGVNREEATVPLYVEHNGNRLAFIGVNSYGPPSAWATETVPGSAPYDLAMLSATIRSIKQQELADVVMAEFQYLESYDVEPLWDQRNDFRAVVRAGADIVTGVQSHVPQAIEFINPALPPEPGYRDDRLILYGLGNLFFDQMGSDATRDNLIALHTIYAGRHLSTQLLTTVLYDYGQPRWAEPDRRHTILQRVFGASNFPP